MVRRRISSQRWQIIGLDSSPADFRRFLTVLVDRRLLGGQCCLSTGLVANGIRLTKRCNASNLGVLKSLLIFSKHGTKANIITKMANNRHAYNRDVLQSFWTSAGLPLYCSQPLVRKHTQTNNVKALNFFLCVYIQP
jgi:hypothetical protein